MKIKKRRETLDNLFKSRVVQTVIELIKKNENITMDEVAKFSGVSKGSLYNYFDNKESLMEYVHTEMLAPIKLKFEALMTSGKNPKEMLVEFVDDSLKVKDDVCFYFMFLDSQRTAEEGAKETDNLLIKPLSTIFRLGIDKGMFFDIEPRILAHALFGIIIGFFNTIKSEDMDEENIQNIKESILKLLDRLVIT